MSPAEQILSGGTDFWLNGMAFPIGEAARSVAAVDNEAVASVVNSGTWT